MKAGVGILLSLLFYSSALFALSGAWEKGMVEIRPGEKLYVEQRLAAQGKPTLFLLNGLTWSTRDWADFVNAVDEIEPGVGFVLYDPKGMGQTLLEYAPIRKNISIDDQVEDLKVLREKLNLPGRQALAGLSYGGAIGIAYMAKYPNDFDQAIAMAPFIERLTDQDQLINAWIKTHRMMFPFDPHTDEELYDWYLRVLIYTTYPSAEPVLLENRFKLEATFRMVQGAKDFKALGSVDHLPKNKFHLMGALDDEFVKEERLAIFWKAVRDKAASYLRLSYTKHKIPSQRPETAASWVLQILNGNPNLTDGAVFEGDPIEGEARSGRLIIPLKKAGLCESILRASRGPF